MKKSFIIFGLALAISACGNNKSSNSSGTDTTATTTTTTSSSQNTSVAVKDTLGEALIQKNDCLTCHKLDQKIIGPAYIDVANKYTASPAVIDTLANKIIKGGSGNWGNIAMSPHPNLSMTDAQDMVRYILSLKK
ncbi:c-type cytochrome [Mucilaginibacter sp. L196]|uniref:c-type cytochrome n=1 Tax=Mucilaginibacter sp. L196 TaxID=1641870 RepID=UPI00131CCB8A|nr:c-type cytochrome [Mucilaginibacter sp. L196]